MLTKYVMYQKLTSNSVQTIITKIGFQSLLFNFISKLWAKFCINLWEENVLVPRKLLHNNITTLYALFNVKKMRSIFYLLKWKERYYHPQENCVSVFLLLLKSPNELNEVLCWKYILCSPFLLFIALVIKRTFNEKI